MAESKLETSHQIFIVQHFAMFERAIDIQEALKQNFGVEISLQAVCYYNAENGNLTKKLKSLFNRTRKKFIEDSSAIPIAHKSYRLKKLQQMFEKEESENAKLQNKKAMREILEQSAKESGDAYTNKQKHEHTGKDGDAVMRFDTRVILPNVEESENQ